MTDETWRGIIIRSIPPTPKWLPVIPSLYALSTAVDIVLTLLAHGMIPGQGITTSTTSIQVGATNTALATRVIEGCTNPNCKAHKHSTHTLSNCYWPGGGKEGQFPPNFGQRSKANIATATSGQQSSSTTPGQTDHFVLSAQTSYNPRQSGVLIGASASLHPMALISSSFQTFQNGKVQTFMDSGASDTMFVSRDVFNEYKPVSLRIDKRGVS